ncbi:MAG: methyltransferase domain-containing protein [Bacteroidetes bacterium]|nr:methyltransferase domain-containing protein [Bacteroidota bacterium]
MRLYRNLSESVVELLHEIFFEGRYADKVIEKAFKQNPRWGSRDRRFVAETTYDIVRWYRLYQAWAATGDQDYWSLLGIWCLKHGVELPPWKEFDAIRGVNTTVIPAQRAVRESIPDWLDELGASELKESWDREIHVLNEQARVVLRANTLKIKRTDLQQLLLDSHEIKTAAPENFPDALILEERQNVFTTQAFKDGLFEVQDAGSQLIAPFLEVQPGMRIIDACAGGGGKSLHLAALLKNKGRVISMDTEAWKLEELKKRARRAGISNIETRVIESTKTIKRLAENADRLLLDVPCSGLGVLRRNPDAKWKLDQAFIQKVKETQQQILDDYCKMLKPGGKMVYSTCSILPSENEKQVEAFLKAHPDYQLEEMKTIFPSEGFDGFFMARLLRIK